MSDNKNDVWARRSQWIRAQEDMAKARFQAWAETLSIAELEDIIQGRIRTLNETGGGTYLYNEWITPLEVELRRRTA